MQVILAICAYKLSLKLILISTPEDIINTPIGS